MSDLTEFLLARIAEEEDEARDAIEERSQTPFVVPLSPDYADFGFQSWPDVGVPSVLVGPERVLAECEAKRRIVARHSQTVECGNVGCQRRGLSGLHCLVCDDEWPCPDLRILATIYAGHPSYREEWRP